MAFLNRRSPLSARLSGERPRSRSRCDFSDTPPAKLCQKSSTRGRSVGQGLQNCGRTVVGSDVGKSRASRMRLPFFDPRRDEVAATATDLITRFGLHAHHEASYLAELSGQMHSRWHRVLYGQVAREIDASFVEAQMRLGLRQSAYAKDTKTAAGALRRASASVT